MATKAKPIVDEDEKRRIELYDSFRKDACASIASSSDDFDKSVLTYSSAGLGLSIAFVKDIVVLKDASATWLLHLSWAAFCLAIVLTTTSFLISMKAHMRSLDDAEKYYLDNDAAYRNRPNPYDDVNTVLVRVAGASFIAAVLCTVIFASLNLNQEKSMTNIFRRPITGIVPSERGRPVPAKAPTPPPPSAPASVPTPTPAAPPPVSK